MYQISKHEFVQNTSKYLKLSEQEGGLVITHHNKPKLILTPIKAKTLKDLRGKLGKIIVSGNINSHELPGFDEW